MALARDSSNLLIMDVVVDYNDLLPDHKTPDPADGVLCTAQVYAPDRVTPIGPLVNLVIEDDQPTNYYRGVLPATVDFGMNEVVWVKYTADGGTDLAKRVKWVEEKVVYE